MKKFFKIFVPVFISVAVLAVCIWAGVDYNKKKNLSPSYETKVSSITLDEFLTDFVDVGFENGFQTTLLLNFDGMSEPTPEKSKTVVSFDKFGNLTNYGYVFDAEKGEFNPNPTAKVTVFDGVFYHEQFNGNNITRIKMPYSDGMASEILTTKKPVKDLAYLISNSDLNTKNVAVKVTQAGENSAMYEFEFSTTIVTEVTVECTYSCSFTIVNGFITLYSYTLAGQSTEVVCEASVSSSAWNGIVENVPNPEDFIEY